MAVTRNDTDEVYGLGGLISSKPVVRDITADSNQATLRQRAQNALAVNATYLGIATPTAAQTTAQVQRVTRECSALIRMTLSLLDDISDS